MSIEVISNEPAPKTPAAPASEATAQGSGETTSSVPAENAEQNESEASETPETETPEGEEPEPKDGDPDPKEGNDDKAGKKKSGSQRNREKIEKLRAAKTRAEQESEFWKQQALKSAGEPKPDPKVEPKPAAASEGKPRPEKFDTHAEYVEALTDWKTDQKLNEREQKAEKTRLESEQAKLGQSHADRITSFKASHDDFDEMMDNLADVPRTPALEHVIKSSENGPELLYELAKKPEEAKRIAMLPYGAMLREIGKFEAGIAAKSASEPKPETKRVSSAPKPIAPVGGGGKASAPPKTLEEAANHSFAEFKRIRSEHLKQNRRRA